jgi:hypothetical protein
MTEMTPATAAASRPRDVVFAGVLTIMGSVLALAGIFSTQGELRSSSVRREIESVLADERFSAFDLSVESVLTMVETALMVASAASVAAIVLAVYVMRRHNPSRIALTLLGGFAALLVLFSGLAGVAIAVFVAYTVSLLWRQPVRLWFASESGSGSGQSPGREPEGANDGSTGGSEAPGSEPAPPYPGGSDQPAQPAQPHHPQQPGPYPGPWPPDPGQPGPPPQQPAQPQSPPPPGHEQPGPYAPGAGPYGQPPQGYGGAPGYGGAQGYGQSQGYPQAYPPYGYTTGYYGYPPAHRDPDSRPGQLVTAHVLTWVGAALALLTALFLVIAASSPDIVDLAVEQLQTEGVTEQDLVTTMRVGGIITALWAAAVIVVSIFSWRRANWAAILLTVMGGAYMLTQLISLVVMGQVAVLFTIVWVAAVLTLLWWPTSRQWYATARGRGGFGGPGGQPPYPEMPPHQSPSQPPRNRPW